VDIQIIKQPAAGVIRMLESRTVMRDFIHNISFDTIGLVQGKLIEMVVAIDIAEKASGVEAIEIKGVCPQHFTLLAIFGDTAAVSEAIERIREKLGTPAKKGEF
jgi:hypothetical protein